MGLEIRKGKTYYYRKRRQGNRVVSEYAGGGGIAFLVAQLETNAHAEQKHDRVAEKRKRAAFERTEKEVNALMRLTTRITRAALVANGFHTYKGQWRKRRT